MLNYIWLGLMVCAVLIGGWNGQLKAVANGSLDWANIAVVNIAFTLIGVMALWLGIMRLAERAGLVALLARALRPVMRWIFPEVPAEHPAMGAMLMNISANMLGLGNAATPFGLRAMKDLESLNPRPGTATNAMCTFLAINTSGIQLVPVTAIAILVANKSTNPTAIVGTSLICTACAAVAGVLMAKFLSHLPGFRQGRVAASGSGAGETPAPAATAEAAKVNESFEPLKWWGKVVLVVFLLFFAWLFVRLAFPDVFGRMHKLSGEILPEWFGRLVFPSVSGQAGDTEPAAANLFVRLLGAVSLLAIPFLLSAIPLWAAVRRVKVYDEFVDGAKEGFNVAVRIIPYLVAMLVAVGMFRAAGGIDWLSRVLAPVFALIGFPTDLLPMVLVRPLSGTASLGFFTELVKTFGPDSLIARMG